MPAASPDRAEPPIRRPRRGAYARLSVKLVVGFTLLFTLLFAGVFSWFYSVATGNALTEIKQSLTNTITGAVAGIDGDEFAALVRDGQPNAAGLSDDPRYARLLAWLETVRGIDPRAWPYTYASGPAINGQPTSMFIVDIDAGNTNSPGFKEPWPEATPESHAGFEQLTFQLRPYTDQWGTWVSAYAPIKDSSGDVVGAVGVDYEADSVLEVRQQILSQLIPAMVVTYLVLVLVVLVLSHALTEPVRKLTNAARGIAQGNYDQHLTGAKPPLVDDEISTLTRVFEVMVDKVREREQVLAQKVERLSIEIDEANRQQAVSQIVETDFFQELQARANEMRRRKRSRPPLDGTSN